MNNLSDDIKVKRFDNLIKQPDKLDQYFTKFFRDSFNPTKVREIKKKMIYLVKPKGSGAKIGLFIDGVGQRQVTSVVKIYEYARKSFVKKNHCYHLDGVINEIFINLVITHPYRFNKKIKKDHFVEHIKPYINFVKDIGNDNESIYLMTNYLGVYDNYYNDRYHNLYDLIRKNHIQIIRKLKTSPNFQEILRAYEDFMLNDVIKPYITVLKYYQKHVGFVHTDLKLDNIFVKKISKSKEHALLRKNNIMVDFSPMLADFDKSRVNLPGFSILPNRRFKNKVLKGFPNITGIVDDVRYNCRVKFGTHLCRLFSFYDFDLLCLMISLNFLLFDVVDDVSVSFPKLTAYWIDQLQITDELFGFIQKISKKNKGSYFANINNTIRLTCRRRSIGRGRNKNPIDTSIKRSTKKKSKSKNVKSKNVKSRKSKSYKESKSYFQESSFSKSTSR